MVSVLLEFLTPPVLPERSAAHARELCPLESKTGCALLKVNDKRLVLTEEDVLWMSSVQPQSVVNKYVFNSLLQNLVKSYNTMKHHKHL